MHHALNRAQFDWTGYHGTSVESAQAIENRTRGGQRGLLPSSHGDHGPGVYVHSPQALLSATEQHTGPIDADERAEYLQYLDRDSRYRSHAYGTIDRPDDRVGTHGSALVHVGINPESVIETSDMGGSVVHPNGVTVRRIDYPSHTVFFPGSATRDVAPNTFAPVTRGK